MFSPVVSTVTSPCWGMTPCGDEHGMPMAGSQAAPSPALPPSAPWPGRPCRGEQARSAAGEKIPNGKNYPQECGGAEAAACGVLGWEPESGASGDRFRQTQWMHRGVNQE